VRRLAEVKPLLRDRATITAADINSAERAVERQMLIINAELKRVGILATTARPRRSSPAWDDDGYRDRVPRHVGVGRLRLARRDHGGRRRSAHHDGLGLLVAIPAVWLYNYFATKSTSHGGDDVHAEGADRLPHQERRQRVGGRSSPKVQDSEASQTSGPSRDTPMAMGGGRKTEGVVAANVNVRPMIDVMRALI